MKRPLGARVQRAFKSVGRAYRELIGEESNAAKGSLNNRLMLDWVMSNLAIDDEVRGNIRKMRARVRHLCRNDSYAKNFLRALCTNVIGAAGIQINPQVKNSKGEPDKVINEKIEAVWNAWAKKPVTVDGKWNLHQVEQLLLKSLARDGELLYRKYFGFDGNRFGFAIQPIDPDLLDEAYSRPGARGVNEVRMGVEVDELGRPIAYHIWNRPWSSWHSLPRERVRVPAAEIRHVFLPERPNQTRGLTWFDSVMTPLHMLEGYEEAELVAARIAAAKMGFIETTAEGSTWAGDGEKDDDPEWDATPGAIEKLPVGQKFNGWDPQHPTQAFPAFQKAILRKASTGLGCSYAGLSNDLSDVNFSSLRSGKQDERDTYEMLHVMWISDVRDDLVDGLVSMTLLNGMLTLPSRDPSRYLPFIGWDPRGWDWVDPLKDAQTVALKLGLGLTSRKDECAKVGTRYTDNFEQLAAEMKLAEQLGITITGPAVVTVEAEKDDGDGGKTKPADSDE